MTTASDEGEWIEFYLVLDSLYNRETRVCTFWRHQIFSRSLKLIRRKICFDSTSFTNTVSFQQICFIRQRSAVWSECLQLNASRGVISKEYLENYSGNEFNSNVMSYISKLGKHHLGLSIPVSRSLAEIISQMDKSKTGFVLLWRLRWKP